MGDVVDEDPPWSVDEQDPLTQLIERQAGIIAWWQACRFLTEKAIRHRVSSGRWRRVHRGVYATYGGHLSPVQRQWTAVLSAGPSTKETGPVALGGVSALQVHGLRNITADRVHLVLGTDRRTTPPGLVAVHRARLADEDLHPCAHPPTTTIGRAVVDAAAWARSDDEARLVIAASFQQRLVTKTEISQTLDRMPATRRRLLVITTVADAASGSHTLGELDFVQICRTARLPLPTRQAKFRDFSGRTRYLDAVFDPWLVAVEVDGAHHGEVAQRWDDIGRDNGLLVAKFRVVRFPLHVVRREPRRVAATLRATLEVAGWHPGLPTKI